MALCVMHKASPFSCHRKYLRASILLHDVGHQAEIALDEDVAGGQVALGCQSHVVPFFFRGQGFWKGRTGIQAQRVDHSAENQPDGCGKHFFTSAFSVCFPLLSTFPGWSVQDNCRRALRRFPASGEPPIDEAPPA